MENQEKAAVDSSKAPVLPKTALAPGSRVGHAVAVLSGKGGVGKSFTACYLAVLLKRKGFKVGILDADVTGPSVPFVFKVKGPVMGNGSSFYPIATATGIQVMSSNLLLDHPEDPIVWRGPMISTLCEQFYSEVVWDVDYLIIDMAPGTADVSLTVFQKVKLSSAILVATPQNLVSLIVEKSAKMADMLSVPILSLVENMAYVKCPKCGERINVFGKTEPDLAKRHGIPNFAEVPFDERIAASMDAGDIENLKVPYLDATADAIVAAASDADVKVR